MNKTVRETLTAELTTLRDYRAHADDDIAELVEALDRRRATADSYTQRIVDLEEALAAEPEPVP